MLSKRNTSHGSRVIIFLGAPGSGKGTQTTLLSSEMGIPSLSTGDALRAEAKLTTPAGLRLRQLLASGSLVSDEVVCGVVGKAVKRDAPHSGLILDGFPRTVKQATYLDSVLADLGLPRPVVIYLDVSKDLLLRRLTARRHCAVCGTVYNLLSRPSQRGPRCEMDGGLLIDRDDDSPGVVSRRLEEFEASNSQLLQYYRNAEVHRIDGNRTLELVSAELKELVSRETLCIAA